MPSTPQYVSSATQSVIVTLTTVNGTAYTGSPASIATNLTTSDPDCTTTSGTLTCTVSAPSVVGNDVYSVVTYNAQQSSTSPATPAGAVLSQAMLPLNVVANQLNTPATPLVLNGVLASIAVTSSDPHILGTQTTRFSIVGNRPATLMVSALDASGKTIIGPGAPALAVQSGSSAITVSPANANTYTLQVKSLSATPVALTVTPAQGDATNVTFATVEELWVASFASITVTAYAAGIGTQITADTITAGIDFPAAIATDANGNLWVANENGNTVTAYVPGTNTPIAGDTITTGLDIPAGLVLPVGLAFDANGNLWVSNFVNKTVTAYAPGTHAQIASDTITAGIAIPVGLAFDAHGNLWVANAGGGNNTVTAYAAGTTAQIAADTITAGLNQPNSLAFDASGNLWVGNPGNTAVTAYAAGTNT
ncbi:MAG: Vgb family protein, partial [Vulcanimicrobiaceae bacterium]